MQYMRRLLLLGLAIELICLLALARPLHVFDRVPGPTTDFLKIMGESRRTFAWYVGTFGALFLLYVGAYLVSRRLPQRAAIVVIGFGLLFTATLATAYPAASKDFFGYILESRLYWVHDVNPLVMPRGSVWSDPFRPYSDWTNLTSSYGPAWILLTGLPLAVGHGARLVMADGDLLFTVLAFKGLMLALYAATAVVVVLAVRTMRPELTAAGAVLFAWNPLVLYEVGVNGHNDLSMALFAVLALYFALSGRWWASFPCLALAILMKYTGALFAPPLALYALLIAWKGGWRVRASLALGALLGLATAVVVVAPFWVGVHTFSVFWGFTDYYIFSPFEIAMYVLARFGMPRAEAEALLKPLFFGVSAVVYLAVLAGVRRRPETLVRAAALGVAVYLLIGAFWFHSWYVIWLVPVAAILPTARTAPLAMLFSLTASQLDAVWLIAWRLRWYGDHLGLARGITVVAVFGPVLLYLVVWAVWHNWPAVSAVIRYWWREQWWGVRSMDWAAPAAMVRAATLEPARED
jgi:hypothetical protein